MAAGGQEIHRGIRLHELRQHQGVAHKGGHVQRRRADVRVAAVHHGTCRWVGPGGVGVQVVEESEKWRRVATKLDFMGCSWFVNLLWDL